MKRLIPKKGDFRMRAHINPLNSPFFSFPRHPGYVDWRQHFPRYYGGSEQENVEIHSNTEEHPCNYDRYHGKEESQVRILDVGCGYGGLLFGLAPLFPNKLILGLEIRDKLVNYAAEKISAYRRLYPQQYDHISVVRANTMKHLCHYFPKGSIQKIFICFPDPHFKHKKFKRRVINTGFLSQYAFLLKEKGRIYCVTDVEQLHKWHLDHLHGHQQFRQISDDNDQCVPLMLNATQESQKVQRSGGQKYWALFQKI